MKKEEKKRKGKGRNWNEGCVHAAGNSFDRNMCDLLSPE